ncbi:MAG TPA: acyl-CoA thioesterase II [Gammaproteobacteria bacterium]|nr:acyl-CoA thioesterase II [Gammaproteobacteria bacterium]
MPPIVADLLKLLELERIEDRIFRGESRDLGGARVFGGQVLGQALTAASYTVQDRRVHSLHAYFLVAGDVNAPIVYEVEVARDGKSFSNRRVVAIQHGQPIFNMTASFQVPEEGLEHAAPMPQVPGPEGLADVRELPPDVLEKVPEKMRRFLTHERPFEFRPVEPIHIVTPPRAEPVRHIWLKTLAKLPDNADLHRNVLAYVSDYQLVSTATLPHGIHFAEGNVQLASLDHAMWFHRPFRADEWLLYAMESPNASGGRGLALGRFFTRNGALVASTAQEGVVRVWTGR